MLNRIIRYFLENRVITLLLLVLIIIWGISTSPFNWHGGIIPRNPIPVDAIPDIGDNQQIVATEWMVLAEGYTRPDHLSADHLSFRYPGSEDDP